MTRQQWKDMTADERRARIARICGYKHPRWIGPGDWREFVGEKEENGEKYVECNIDDYERDLDAMHEAEKLIPHDMVATYASHLADTPPEGSTSSSGINGWLWHTTAAQRAEAFALTMPLDDGEDQKELNEMAEMALEG